MTPGSGAGVIVHVIGRDEWAAVEAELRPASLGVEGFVHCADPDQVAGVIERYYADRDDLLLLHIDPSRVTAPIIREDTTGRGEVFPHVHGPIPRTAIIAVTPA
ncbi:DUF952 domain-containing protein [Euzebya rosea]|uniref:DUF952 domain-containing protein n=1 Tax=Euzebya rosea TaxID=2052804 RepID=UPI000D3EB238|nr:DUF952 domain-containing protein [Euzebya rosea]